MPASHAGPRAHRRASPVHGRGRGRPGPKGGDRPQQGVLGGARRRCRRSSLPVGVQQFIGQELERLGPEQQRILEAASVAGLEFPVAGHGGGVGYGSRGGRGAVYGPGAPATLPATRRSRRVAGRRRLRHASPSVTTCTGKRCAGGSDDGRRRALPICRSASCAERAHGERAGAIAARWPGISRRGRIIPGSALRHRASRRCGGMRPGGARACQAGPRAHRGSAGQARSARAASSCCTGPWRSP